MSASLEASSLFRLDGSVAVVTGGGTGIVGLTIAQALDANGAKAVYIIGRREDKLREAANSAASKSLVPIVGDVTSQDFLKAAAKRVRREQGYVNAVLANAAVEGFGDTSLTSRNGKPAQELVDMF